MRDRLQAAFSRWRLDDVFREQPGLRFSPTANGKLAIAGTLSFSAQTPGLEQVNESFELEILIPISFPKDLPSVRDVGGRIPKNFHTDDDGQLCLGSPTQQLLLIRREPTLPGFVRNCLIPYLYGFVIWERHGMMPFGELKHGRLGVLQDYISLFKVKSEAAALGMLRLAGMKKSAANKHPCPCGSNRRLGKCHSRIVTPLRSKLGSKWFRGEYVWLTPQ
jgi:hypothetical protein